MDPSFFFLLHKARELYEAFKIIIRKLFNLMCLYLACMYLYELELFLVVNHCVVLGIEPCPLQE